MTAPRMFPSTPPPAGRMRNLDYPDIPVTRLGNGLLVLTVEDHTLPRVSIKLGIPVGRVFNPPDNLSLAGLATQLLREGTARYGSREIAEIFDQLAIDFGSDLFMEHTLISMSVLEKHLERALELLAEVVLQPSFPQDELDRLRVRWRSSLLSQRSQPDFLARERAAHALFEDHPYSRASIPPEHLDRSTRDGVSELYFNCYGPVGSCLFLAGAVRHDQALQVAGRYLGAWKPQEALQPVCPAPGSLETHRVCLVHRPHSVQSRIVVGGRTLPKAHPESIPLKVTNQILGGSASARLFMNLREEKGYTYGAYSLLKDYRRGGLYLAGASVNSEVTVECVGEFLRELGRLRTSPPSEEELSRARSELTGAFLRQMQTPGSIASLELIRRLYDLHDGYFRSFIPEVNRVSRDHVVEVARRYFDPDRTVITVVGDRNPLKDGLARFGHVEVYNSEGTLIDD